MFRPMIYVIIKHLLWSITQVIKLNCNNMDSCYATGVCCYGRLLLCTVSVNIQYNIIMKRITNSYDLKFKYCDVFRVCDPFMTPVYCVWVLLTPTCHVSGFP
jgi:hypothetical protein